MIINDFVDLRKLIKGHFTDKPHNSITTLAQKVELFTLRAIINTELAHKIPEQGAELLQRTLIGILFKTQFIYKKQKEL